MLNIDGFKKIFKAPARHNQKTEHGNYAPPVSDNMKKEVYDAIYKTGIATTNSIIPLVSFQKTSVRRCINHLLADKSIREHATKVVGRATITSYRVLIKD